MLEAGDAVASAGVDRDTRGPAATRVSLHPRLGVAAAAHIGHHSMQVSVIDATGMLLAQQDAPLGRLENRAADISRMITECVQTVPGPLRRVVVGMPGIVGPGGEIRDDLGPDGGAFRAAVEGVVGCRVQIENDVNLAAIAEAASGVGQELSSFTLLYIDHGLGAGTVLDGALRRGASGIAGEVQYMPQPSVPIGIPVLNETVVEDLARSHGRDPHATLPAHLDACEAGDDAAREMIDELARRLVLVAGGVTLVVDPEAFVLAGHAAHPCFVTAMLRAAEAMSHLLAMRFVPSAFGGEAAMVGAISEAAQALRECAFDGILSTRSLAQA